MLEVQSNSNLIPAKMVIMKSVLTIEILSDKTCKILFKMREKEQNSMS